MNKTNESTEHFVLSNEYIIGYNIDDVSEIGMGFMNDLDVSFSDEEFYQLFNEARYAFNGTDMFFRKARHGLSFIRAES